MNEKEIASEMSAFHQNESLGWDKIIFGYKKVTKEQAIEYIKQTIEELQEMLTEFEK